MKECRVFCFAHHSFKHQSFRAAQNHFLSVNSHSLKSPGWLYRSAWNPQVNFSKHMGTTTIFLSDPTAVSLFFSVDYLLIIITIFPNFPRPWPKISFPPNFPRPLPEMPFFPHFTRPWPKMSFSPNFPRQWPKMLFFPPTFPDHNLKPNKAPSARAESTQEGVN